MNTLKLFDYVYEGIDISHLFAEYDADPETDADADLRYEINEHLADLLQDFYDLYEYIHSPVTAEGVLELGDNGRYYISGTDKYFCCGYRIEFYYYDNDYERFRWFKSRIEHNDGGYYIYGHRDIGLTGLKVRVRW